ncbi:MAG: glycoside hydrolase family 2 protein [Anaerolineae bacterium]
MNGNLSLDGNWKIKGIDGRRGSPESFCVESVDERTFIDAQVPGEVHLDLLRQGIIGDPRLGTEALRSRWVEEQYWVYRRRFEAPPEALAAHKAWLVFEGLDLYAEVYLNGVLVGGHHNAFRPCRLDVTGKLRPGANILAVLLDAGLHEVGELSASEYMPGRNDAPLHKRMWLRKPQYQFAWDWNPRLVNVGIFRPCHLEWAQQARIDQVTIYPEITADLMQATLQVRAHLENVSSQPLAASIRVSVPEVPGCVMIQEVILPPGLSSPLVAVTLDKPRLWWPRPHGDQPLYTVQVELLVAGDVADQTVRRTGVRSVCIQRDPHPEGGEYFTIQVNGVPIFCKGGNWVPADMIYADVDARRYRALINEAVNENMNTLRIWGGGLYVDHEFLDACDEAGVMVWHDCIFACSKYPAGDPGFLDEVRREITFVSRELSPHPSLLVWCGNNELEWGAWDWGYDHGRAHPDYALFHLELPRIFTREDPSRPYWPSSPYSPNSLPPNMPTIGDQHPWHVSIMEDRENFYAYRQDVSRFPNEGGALGCSSPATLRQFLPANEQHYLSPSWEYHDNEIAWRANSLMIEEWFATWLGLKPGELSLDDYAFYSGALQAEALLEYINNFRRRMWSTSSAIFWMYNDSWPVTHGWTTVDYYMRHKLAYHVVRRAFEPIQVIPVVENNQLVIIGVNDTLQPWVGETRYGLARYDGHENQEQSAPVVLAPNAATILGIIPLPEQFALTQCVAYATLWQNGVPVRQNRMMFAQHKEVLWSKPEISCARDGNHCVFSSPTFVWAVCLDPDGEKGISDDMFDLLPGFPYRIAWPQEKELPKIVRWGNLP